MVILFFGVAFLLRYAYEHVHVPIELRLAGVAAAAIVLLALGWRLRERRPGYGLALQGGGIGVLYLVIFARVPALQPLPAGAGVRAARRRGGALGDDRGRAGRALARGARRLAAASSRRSWPRPAAAAT